MLSKPDTIDSLGPSQERLGFTLFMSLCVHAVVVLGVGFTVSMAPKVANTIEVTLAAYRSDEAPADADFLAQANQQGSGSESKKLAPATTQTTPFTANNIAQLEQYMAERPVQPASTQPIVARAKGTEAKKEEVKPKQPDLNKLNSDELGTAVASLQAQLDLHRQEYAKMPRRHTISSAATQASRDAAYLDAWRKRIEAVGNKNYPSAASTDGIYGALRLMVAINPDGSVNDIRILRSSGQRVLDEAAVRIVQLSAPFQPFPADMRKDVDVLEIIRTWQFQRGNTFSSF